MVSHLVADLAGSGSGGHHRGQHEEMERRSLRVGPQRYPGNLLLQPAIPRPALHFGYISDRIELCWRGAACQIGRPCRSSRNRMPATFEGTCDRSGFSPQVFRPLSAQKGSYRCRFKNFDLYKVHKTEYVAAKKPCHGGETRPAQYLTITGRGAPASTEFQNKIGTLYGVAFTL